MPWAHLPRMLVGSIGEHPDSSRITAHHARTPVAALPLRRRVTVVTSSTEQSGGSRREHRRSDRGYALMQRAHAANTLAWQGVLSLRDHKAAMS